MATVAAAGVIATPSAQAANSSIAPCWRPAPNEACGSTPLTVVAGGVISSKTTLVGDVDTPASVVLSLFPSANCTGTAVTETTWGDQMDAAGDADPNDVISGTADPQTFVFSAGNVDAGTYSWRAVFKEDGESDESTCTTTATTVGKASPSLTVGATNAATGGKIQATGTIVNRSKPAPQNGDGSAPWTMRFDVYGPSDPTCSGTPVDSSTRAVYNSEHTYKSDAFTATAAGTYRWKVTYSGDPNNNTVASNCGTPSSVVTSGGTPPPPPPPSSKWTCHGVTATFVGTNQAERIIGSPGDDVIVARGGNDIIDGRGGNDIICGGNGKDTIRGGTGNDVLRGGFGNDVLAGGQGNDRLYGEAGRDRLDGNAGDDALDGGSGKDTGRGGKGRDTVKSL